MGKESQTALNGDCLELCLRLIIELQSPGNCYELVLDADAKNADAILMKLNEIFLRNSLTVGLEEKNKGSVKLTYRGSCLDMWRMLQIAQNERLPTPIQLDSTPTETRETCFVRSLSTLYTTLKSSKHSDRQWVIILGTKVHLPSRAECLREGFKLIKNKENFFNQLNRQSQPLQSKYEIKEDQLKEWIDEYPTKCQSFSAEQNRMLEVYAASLLCQLFGTSWWESSTNKTVSSFELIRELSSKKITLVTQDWHNFTEQLWGFKSISVDEAIKEVRTDSVNLDMKSLEGKVVHLLGSFTQPETLLPSFASALVNESSAAFLLGLFNALKTSPELRIAMIGTDEDEELRDGLTAWYQSTRPDLDIEDSSTTDSSHSLQDRVYFFTSTHDPISKHSGLFVVSRRKLTDNI